MHASQACCFKVSRETAANSGGSNPNSENTMLNLRKTSRRPSLATLALVLPFLGLTSQAQVSFTNGLVAYWNFDGTLVDSIDGFHGAQRGTLPIPFVDGKAGFGKAIKLNGDDQLVEIIGGAPDDLAFPS